jgi:hypothetical protein
MRIPVFSRRSNPAVDPPILRKSLSYAEQQVREYRAAWVDPSNPRQGIVCCAYLDSVKALPQPEVSTAPPPDVGLRFVPPPQAWKNPTLPRLEIYSLAVAIPGWDYSVSA